MNNDGGNIQENPPIENRDSEMEENHKETIQQLKQLNIQKDEIISKMNNRLNFVLSNMINNRQGPLLNVLEANNLPGISNNPPNFKPVSPSVLWTGTQVGTPPSEISPMGTFHTLTKERSHKLQSLHQGPNLCHSQICQT